MLFKLCCRKKRIIINRSNYHQTVGFPLFSEMDFKRTAQGNNGQQV